MGRAEHHKRRFPVVLTNLHTHCDQVMPDMMTLVQWMRTIPEAAVQLQRASLYRSLKDGKPRAGWRVSRYQHEHKVSAADRPSG